MKPYQWPCLVLGLVYLLNQPHVAALARGRSSGTAFGRREPAHLPFKNIVIVVTSPIPWLYRRELIRRQFPRNMQMLSSNHTVALRFAVGTQHLEPSVLAEADREQDEKHDLLFLNCQDIDTALLGDASWGLDAGPSATTQKVLLSVEWAVKTFTFDYFIRLGDDSYFRVDRFVSLWDTLPKQNAVVGKIMKANILGMEQVLYRACTLVHANITLCDDLCIPLFAPSVQEYAQGAGYVLTADICYFIAKAKPWLLSTAPEDGVIARWFLAIGAKLVNHPGWRALDLGETCEDHGPGNDLILAHKLPSEVWANISSDGTINCTI